uniref:non-specific serine/threonine protein kinase n=1 Tax=Haemonchus contortus TaxID=6289 RepID=W6NCK6_HAECO
MSHFRGRFYIQTELCGANLHDYRAHYGPLVENEQWTVFEDTLKALERLHSEDMLHLDVKPSNIYLSLDRRSCKLGDFGLAINLKKVAADWADDGDKNYMAPELLNESPTTAADMFSLGITMLELSTDIDVESKKKVIQTGKILRSQFKGVAVGLHDEIMSLLNQSPKDRPTATELLGRIGFPERQRAVFKNLEKVTTPLDKDYFLDKDWDFESEDVIHPPSLRMKRKYDCTVFGMQPVRKRLVFDELEEDELPSPKVESTTVGPNTSVFTRILDFSESPLSPPRKKARGVELREKPSA